MNKSRGPLSRKGPAVSKRNQGGPRKWSQKPGASDFTTTAVVATSKNPNKKTRKVRHGR